jgi:Yip1-like protein
MALVDRVKGILLEPKNEWPKIAAEAATPQSIYTGYVMILAAIGPLALALRGAIVAAIISYGIALAVTYVLAFIVDALAPTFSAEKNFVQSLKLAAYSYTAAWIAGIFQLIPFVGRIIGLLAAIYSFYTFYLGLPVLKKCPADKAVGYTIVVVVCGIVIWLLLAGVLMSMVVGGSVLGMMGPGMFH